MQFGADAEHKCQISWKLDLYKSQRESWTKEWTNQPTNKQVCVMTVAAERDEKDNWKLTSQTVKCHGQQIPKGNRILDTAWRAMYHLSHWGFTSFKHVREQKNTPLWVAFRFHQKLLLTGIQKLLRYWLANCGRFYKNVIISCTQQYFHTASHHITVTALDGRINKMGIILLDKNHVWRQFKIR